MKQTTSAKSTKRALIASAACTVLCGLLLFSTSIAWFTANKESSVNELYSGNLDVELSYSKDMTENSWKPVTAETDDMFKVGDKNMLWEPGAVNVVYFKIENKGSLAAKYDFTVDIDSEVEGTNFAGTKFKLSDYIKGGVVDVTAAYPATDEGRTAAINAVGDAKTLQEIHTGTPLLTNKLNGVPVGGTEPAENTTKTFALVLYMPDNVGDATNYKTPGSEEQRPKVSLKVKLIAAQDIGDADSFGSEYDKGAYEIKVVVPTLAEGATPEQRQTAITNAVKSAVEGAENGSTVLLPKTTGEASIKLPDVSKNVTVKGDGSTKIDATGSGSVASVPNGATFEGLVFDFGQNGYHGFQHSGPIEFKNCTINGKLTLYGPTVFTNCTINTTTSAGADYIWTYGQDVTFDGCTFNTTGKAILCYNEADGSGYNNVTVENCTFNATAGAKASAIANQNCAAIEIDNYGCGVNLVLQNNTVQIGEDAFSGVWRIKSYYTDSTNDKIIVNGVEYTSIAIDGKTMTIDSSKNVTVNQ